MNKMLYNMLYNNNIKERSLYMITKEQIKTYKIPGLKPLDEKQLGFFVYVQNGMIPIDAYIKNYGRTEDKKQAYDSLNARAQEKIQTKWYKQYKEFYEDIKKEQDSLNAVWTLEMSIHERKKLYELNKLEVDRLAKAYNMEIEYYTKKKIQAMEEDDEKKVEEYEYKIIRAAKSKNMAVASNTACVQALEGLDKLKGLQTVNLNHTGEINFFGEDMWSDDTNEEQE